MSEIPIQPTEDTPQIPVTGGLAPDVSEGTASTIAAKLKAAKVFEDKSLEDVRDSILAGKEKMLRDEGASADNAAIIQEKNKKVEDAIRNHQGPLLMEDYQKIIDKVNTPSFLDESTDPSFAFEKFYTKYAFNQFSYATLNTDSDLTRSMFAEPEYTQKAISVGTELSTKYAVIDRLIADANDTIAKQGTLGWLADQAKSMVPFIGQAYTELKLRNNTKGVSNLNLLGENLDEQGKAQFRKPVSQFTADVTERYNALKKDNPTVALAWLQGIRGASATEKNLNDLFTLSLPADIITGGGILKSLAAKTADKIAVREAIKDVVKAAATKGDFTVETIAATGDIGASSSVSAAKSILRDFKPTAAPIEQALEHVPSGFKADITDIKSKPSSLGTGLTNMLVEAYNRTADRLVDIALTTAKVQRIPFEQITAAQMRELKDTIRAQYPGISNSILDITSPAHNPVTNTWYMDVAIGKPGAELWANKAYAERYAQTKGITNYTLEKQGAGWYIRVTRNVNEEMPLMQQLLIDNEKGQSKKGVVNSVLRLGWLRTPEDVISENARVNRKVATYAQARLNALANEERVFMEDVKKGRVRFDPVTGSEIPWYKRIPANAYNRIESAVTRRGSGQWDRLERTLKANQSMVDEAYPDSKGMFFKTPADLEDFYLRNFNQLPSPEETMAYFANKRLVELDRSLRNLGVYRNKARLGAANYKISVLNSAGKTETSPSFDGIRQYHLPGGDDSVLVMGKEIGQEKIYNFGEGKNISDKTLDKLREEIKAGRLQVIRIYDPEQRALNGFGKVKGERIRYVITPTADESPLSFDQVPRRGGGHIEYDYDHYIKQANIREERVGKKFTNWYEGDTTVMPVQLRGMGEDVAKKLNEVRLMLKKKDVKGAQAYAEKNLPIEFSEIQKWFKSGRLSYDEPFVVVPKNRSIIDIDKALEKRYEYEDAQGNIKTTFRDGTRSGSDARQFQVEYTGQRDAYDMFTFKDVGGRHNPIYERVDAETIDPIPMTNRAMGRIIQSTFMDDIKISQMEQWIKEHGNVLAATDSELRSAPFYHFNNPVYKKGADPSAVQQAKITNFQLRQFVGMPHTTDTFLHSVAQKLAEQAYKSLGPKGAAIVPHWLITKVKDPFTFVRSMTYHMKLGLFAWPQIFVQNQTFTNIWALSPRAAMSGTYGAFLHQWARLNPNMVESLDKYAAKISIPGFHSWKPGEFAEAHRLLSETGFGNVGSEYIDVNALSHFRSVRNAGREFLDMGQVFFKEGEQNIRFGAFYTAYKEFRNSKPLGAITTAERAQILDRADLLYTNMSRASASTLHTGIFSLTSQFLSYQMRLAELFLSKRIGATWQERALTRTRMLMANGIMYGLPVGLGVTGLPVADYIRKQAIENGYVVGDNFLSSMIMEGVPAMLTALATGEGDAFDVPGRLQSGNWYDIGPRYGSSGFDQLRQGVVGQKEWWEILGGPGISTAGKTLMAGSSFLRGMIELASGSPETFPLKWQDLVDPLNQVSSFSLARRHIYMLNTGKVINTQETQMTKPGAISDANAWFMTTFSLSPIDTKDVWLKEGILKEQHDAQKDALKSFIKEMHRSFDAADNNDYEQARDYRTRALAHLTLAGYPSDKIGEALSQAFSGRYSSLVDQIDWDLYFKYAPEDKKDQFMQTYKRVLNIQDKRQGK